MIILIIFMFVVATLAATLNFQTSFAIEISPLLLFGGQNMHASSPYIHKSTFLCELNNEVMAISVFSMSLVANLASILGFQTDYAIETSSLDD